VVVTLTLAIPLPDANMFGLTTQMVAVAATGKEQAKLTCEENPPCEETVIAFVNVAVWPALTVCDVGPEAVREKSGGRTTVSVKLAAEAM